VQPLPVLLPRDHNDEHWPPFHPTPIPSTATPSTASLLSASKKMSSLNLFTSSSKRRRDSQIRPSLELHAFTTEPRLAYSLKNKRIKNVVLLRTTLMRDRLRAHANARPVPSSTSRPPLASASPLLSSAASPLQPRSPAYCSS
jgi:hypothetical protein